MRPANIPSFDRWSIDSANVNPRGITVDPSNVSDIWIVDVNTDQVYQYTGAASRTSGSQAAEASFNLAAGNTNPQGIADPPPVGLSVSSNYQVRSRARMSFPTISSFADKVVFSAIPTNAGLLSNGIDFFFSDFMNEEEAQLVRLNIIPILDMGGHASNPIALLEKDIDDNSERHETATNDSGAVALDGLFADLEFECLD